MNLKVIPLREAVEACVEDEPVYMIVKMDTDLSVVDLFGATAYAIDVDESRDEQFQKILDSVDERKPMPSKSVKKKSKTSNCSQDSKPIVKKLDHGKICALFKAGWPPVKIADEMGCSPSTVTYHLQKEGLA